jgi:hydroxymethylbilane synthase
MMTMKLVRLGARGSNLAVRQAELAAAALKNADPGIAVELSIIKTTGDRILGSPLPAIGDKGLFTKEIEQALLGRAIDLAAHSCKDLPSELATGLAIGAVLPRENPCDALLSVAGYTFETLPPAARIGTSSLRRTAQLKALRPDLVVLPLRGNVETRIRKMKNEGFDAILLAYAGIARLGLMEFVTQVLPPDIMVPAPGQGAIAVEAREDDDEVQSLLKKIHDKKTGSEILAERAFLSRLHGGCQVPVGCLARADGDSITVTGMIASLDGREMFRDTIEGNARDVEMLGAQLAEKLLAAGGSIILNEIKKGCG